MKSPLVAAFAVFLLLASSSLAQLPAENSRLSLEIIQSPKIVCQGQDVQLFVKVRNTSKKPTVVDLLLLGDSVSLVNGDGESESLMTDASHRKVKLRRLNPSESVTRRILIPLAELDPSWQGVSFLSVRYSQFDQLTLGNILAPQVNVKSKPVPLNVRECRAP